MGTGTSKSVRKSPAKRGTSSHRGYNPQKSSWSQAHTVSSRPAAPTNLNVSHALGTALSSNSGQRHHHQQSVSSSSTGPRHKPAAFSRTNQPATAVQNNRNQHARNSQPKSTNGSAGAVKPTKVDDYSNKECGVCGHTGHRTDRCRHRHQTCHICNAPGHLASVCKQKKHHIGSRYRPRD